MSSLLQNVNPSYLLPNNPRFYLDFLSAGPEKKDLMRKDKAKANMPSLCVSSVLFARAFSSCRLVQNYSTANFHKIERENENLSRTQ